MVIPMRAEAIKVCNRHRVLYEEGEISGGKSDASYHERLHLQSLVAAVGLSVDSNVLQL
jgi:hypothetical protein